jgi:aspartate racemase
LRVARGRKTLGILGGMGPLASAALVQTIYEQNITVPEQDAPACVLYSDPRVPDRTRAILDGEDGLMGAWLTEALERLDRLGADKMVIACFTSHAFVSRLPAALARKLISLLDLTVNAIEAEPGPCLLLCTTGCREAGVFRRHARWGAVEDRVLLPDARDQARVHEMIYALKANGDRGAAAAEVSGLLRKYGARAFVAGCTEFHLLTRYLDAAPQQEAVRGIDPLLVLARDLRRWLEE